MRGFLFGVILIVGLGLTILSLRPGGIRRQLRLAARRFRIVLVVAGIYVVSSLVIRVFFPTGPVNDFGPPAIAIVLGIVTLYLARDPAESSVAKR